MRRTAKFDHTTISSVVERALREQPIWEVKRREGIEAIDAYSKQHGYPTADEMAEAEARIDEEHRQARLMLTLRGCDVVPFDRSHVGAVGRLLAQSGTADVVDGFVAVKAADTGATVITADPDDIKRLLGTLGVRVPVLKP